MLIDLFLGISLSLFVTGQLLPEPISARYTFPLPEKCDVELWEWVTEKLVSVGQLWFQHNPYPNTADNSTWNHEQSRVTTTQEVDLDTLMAELDQGFSQVGYVFDHMTDKMMVVYPSVFDDTNDVLLAYASVYADTNEKSAARFGNKVPLGLSCKLRTHHAISLWETVDSFFKLLEGFSYKQLSYQRLALQREYTEVIDRFNLAIDAVQKSNHSQPNSQQMANFTAGFMQTNLEFEKSTVKIFQQAHHEVFRNYNRFLYGTETFTSVLHTFDTDDWHTCKQNFYALNGMINELMVPATKQFQSDSMGIILTLRKGFYDASFTWYSNVYQHISVLNELLASV